MHNTLTQHARCLYGDEHRITPQCGLEPCLWLVLPHRPDEPALMREAAENLWMHGPDRDGIAADPVRRADVLEAGAVDPGT